MVVEVRRTQERLVAAVMSTSKEPLVIVRPNVFLQTSRAIVCLVATLEWAAMGFEFGWVT